MVLNKSELSTAHAITWKDLILALAITHKKKQNCISYISDISAMDNNKWLRQF